MILLVDKWYYPLVKKIEENDKKVLFVQDDYEFFNFAELKKVFQDCFTIFHCCSSELLLRQSIRTASRKLLVIYKQEDYIPTDLRQKYMVVKLDFKDIFPLLNPGAMNWLNNKDIQEIFQIYTDRLNQYEQMSYQDTLNFILTSLYQTNVKVINQEQLLSFLVKYYFINEELRGAVKSWVSDNINNMDLSMETLTNKSKFFSWLNLEWRKIFEIDETSINFSDRNLKFLLLDCFEQGLMEPIDLCLEDYKVDHIIKESREHYWISAGIKNLEKLAKKDSFKNHYRLLEELLTGDLLTYEWGIAARNWAWLIYLKSIYAIDCSILELERRIDDKFTTFIEREYDDLVYDPRFRNSPLNNRILGEITTSSNPFALICFDGMRFTEWFIIREYLSQQMEIAFKESFSFSIIPTVTSYSRRSLFSGKLPVDDDGLGDEEGLFKQFVSRIEEIKEEEIYFTRRTKPEKIDLLGYRVVGLIYNLIDDLAHGANSHRLLLNNVKDQLQESELEELIKYLIKNNFRIYFCSDHGNLLAHGNGYNPKKELIDERASRSVLYRTKNLAENENFKNKVLLQFPNVLGEQYLVTMSDRTKFSNREMCFTHGGINIEEVIVPFIEVIK